MALLAPRTYVPPAWWQAGWRRPPIGSVKEVELLSHLAAVLMPNTPVGELFRSFPSPDGETDLEPALTAYGILKEQQAALFVFYDCRSTGKGIGMKSKLESVLLAYGPPGSHILCISHTESRALEDKVLCVKVPDWKTGDKVSLSEVLTDLRVQVSFGLGRVLCPEVLQQLEREENSPYITEAEDYNKIADALRDETSRQEIGSFLFWKGFSLKSIKRKQMCALLSGKRFETKLWSRIQWLLKSNLRPSQVKETGRNCSFPLGSSLDQNLKVTQQPLLDSGLPLERAVMRFPSMFCSSAEQNLELTVKWLLDLGLSRRQVMKVIRCCPRVLSISVQWTSSNVQSLVDLIGLTKRQVVKIIVGCPDILSTNVNDTVRWFLDFGFMAPQTANMIASYPGVLALSLELSLKPKVQWLLDLGMTKKQVLKAITASPGILGRSLEGNLKPKVQWFLNMGLKLNQVAKTIALFSNMLLLDIEKSWQPKAAWLLELGLSHDQLAKVFSDFPRILGLSLEQNLKPKVQWFLHVGLTRNQVVKALTAWPSLLSYNVQQNLQPKVAWLFELGLTQNQLAKVISIFPRILGLSLEQNLKPKLRWLEALGLQKDQVLKIISSFPLVLKYSINNNLVHKQLLLRRVFGAVGAAEVVLKHPRILGMSYERLSTRLDVLVARNDTMKLPSAMLMTEEQFQVRYCA